MKIQKIIDLTKMPSWKQDDIVVECAECGKHVGLSKSLIDKKNIGLAWFDPYNTKMQAYPERLGSMVHYECLSEKRRKEIEDIDRKSQGVC